MGIENYVLYSLHHSDYPYAIKYSNEIVRLFQSFIEKSLNMHGFASHFTTKRLIKELKRLQPDVVHLHNVHSHDCDLRMLFSYLKFKGVKVFWTFHDCWAFTGNCMYFDAVGCDKWRSLCNQCPQSRKYSPFIDNSKRLYTWKRDCLNAFCFHIITPSHWLADLVKQSYLSQCSISVINNGIDLNVFKPTPSEFRKRYGLEGKFIILGVSFVWESRKGIDVFIKLADSLCERFKIVLVGTNETIDKTLPSNIISIHRTENQRQMSKIYSAADLFVIPSIEDNFPTVILESLACGTPVLTYNTGGCAEIIDESCGTVIEKGDYKGLVNEIYRIEKERPYSEDSCVCRSKKYDSNDKYEEYVKLYKHIL